MSNAFAKKAEEIWKMRFGIAILFFCLTVSTVNVDLSVSFRLNPIHGFIEFLEGISGNTTRTKLSRPAIARQPNSPGFKPIEFDRYKNEAGSDGHEEVERDLTAVRGWFMRRLSL